jgi:predicted peroxiredoxin
MSAKTKITTAVVVFGLLVLAAAFRSQAGTKDMPVRDGVFVHITHGADDPHSVLMGLRMANLMAEDKDVLVYLDIKAVEVVLRDAPDLQQKPFDSSKTQLRALLDKNVPVFVCPGCLAAAGKKPEDVTDGVKIAQKDAFFDFTKGRILTLDY